MDPSGTTHRGDGGDRLRDLTRSGGAGVANTGTIGSLVNRGAIIGGASGGAAIVNAKTGKIGRIDNAGVIEGCRGGASGAAIYSTGPDASIGCVTNSGKIIGHVKIDKQGAWPRREAAASCQTDASTAFR